MCQKYEFSYIYDFVYDNMTIKIEFGRIIRFDKQSDYKILKRSLTDSRYKFENRKEILPIFLTYFA